MSEEGETVQVCLEAMMELPEAVQANLSSFQLQDAVGTATGKNIRIQDRHAQYIQHKIYKSILLFL